MLIAYPQARDLVGNSSFLQEYLEQRRQEGRQEGMEHGEKRGRTESILDILTIRLQPGVVHALKPSLEAIEDIDRLKHLCQTAAVAETLEAFMQTLSE